MILAAPKTGNPIGEQARPARKAWWRPGRSVSMNNVRVDVIEWRAESIRDPLERLRFLRNSVDAGVLAPPVASPKPRRSRRKLIHGSLAAVGVLIVGAFMASPTRSTPVTTYNKPFLMPPPAPQPLGTTPERVWQVEVTPGYETYSNGLRVEKSYETGGDVRVPYAVYKRRDPQLSSAEMHSGPAGIVFHTTESLQIPFEASRNRALKRIGESLLAYVARTCAYHYLIDRFGRVFRVVAEQDAANHAGYSIWADDHWRYLNLNESFLGVSFEARTEEGQTDAHLSPAQVRSAAMLTELLRGRYRIPAANCVTHLQVSVNPNNMCVGYHTDWASGFPFEQLGLPDNYALALPSVVVFGFVCDPSVREAAGPRLLRAIELADADFARRAEEAGVGVTAYRKTVQREYKSLLAEVKAAQREDRAEGDSGQGEKQ